jgi:hypothetical protein
VPRNQFEGQCFRCGKTVKAGEGHFERVGKIQREKFGSAVWGKKWIVQHADCAIEHRGTAHKFERTAHD